MEKTKLKISSQYQITLPKAARDALDLTRTDALMFEVIEGVLCLRRAERPSEARKREPEPQLPEWRYAHRKIEATEMADEGQPGQT